MCDWFLWVDCLVIGLAGLVLCVAGFAPVWARLLPARLVQSTCFGLTNSGVGAKVAMVMMYNRVVGDHDRMAVLYPTAAIIFS